MTLLNPLFFQKLLWLQQQFKQPEQHITNSMQSNAVNISDEWLAFMKGIGMHVGISLDGIPAGGEVGENYITYAEFISFLDRAFTLWWDEYRTVLHIPQFSDFIRAIKNPGTRLAACYWSENCSQEVITLEPNGDVSPHDKYVGDVGSHYGSLMKTDLAELLACSAHNQVAKREEQEAFNKMRQCRWFSLCHGGCPHDRVINRRHVAGYQDNCCGTGKLLATIEGCLNKESRATPKTDDNPHSPSGIA